MIDFIHFTGARFQLGGNGLISSGIEPCKSRTRPEQNAKRTAEMVMFVYLTYSILRYVFS